MVSYFSHSKTQLGKTTLPRLRSAKIIFLLLTCCCLSYCWKNRKQLLNTKFLFSPAPTSILSICSFKKYRDSKVIWTEISYSKHFFHKNNSDWCYTTLSVEYSDGYQVNYCCYCFPCENLTYIIFWIIMKF